MTRPTDDELEAQAGKFDMMKAAYLAAGVHGEFGAEAMAGAAAMLRACKGGAGVSAHDEQIRIWTQEILESLAMTDCLDVKSYDSKVDAYVAVSDELRRILSALEPAPDARQEAWRAGMLDAAKVADRRAEICQDAFDKTQDPTECCAAHEARHIARSIRALAEKGPDHD